MSWMLYPKLGIKRLIKYELGIQNASWYSKMVMKVKYELGIWMKFAYVIQIALSFYPGGLYYQVMKHFQWNRVTG